MGEQFANAVVAVVDEAPAAGDPDDPEWPGGNRSGLTDISRHSGRRIRSLLASVGVTAIPLLHPSDADVWRVRLGYDRESYRAALATVLRSCGVDRRVRRLRDVFET